MWSSPNTYCDHYCFYVALFSALEQTGCIYCSSVLLCWVPVGRLAALIAVQFYCAGFLWADWLHLLQFSFIVLGSCGKTRCTYCSSVLLCWVPVGRLAAFIAVQFYCAGFLWADWLHLLQFSFIVLGSCGQTGCIYCSSVLLCWVPVGRLAAFIAVQFYCAGFLWADWLHLLQFSFIVLGSCGQTGCIYCSSVLLCWVPVG